jgi:hypothetical protein
MIQLRRNGTVVETDPEALARARAHFAAYTYVKLPQFIEPTLLRQLMDVLGRTEFRERVHEGIGTEVCAAPGAATAALELMSNDGVLHDAVAALTGCGAIGCFEGRIYRLNPAEGHYDSWHSDVGQQRLIAVSVNLSRAPFEGGRLQIRRADEDRVLAEVDNPVPGDAVMFRVDPSMRHRVASVVGRNPRTAWAGWFRTQPRFADLLRERLSSQHRSAF